MPAARCSPITSSSGSPARRIPSALPPWRQLTLPGDDKCPRPSQAEHVSAIFKRVGLVVVIFDLLVGAGVGSAAVLHRNSGGTHAAKMSAAALERTVEQSAGARTHTSCTSDPTAGWDYYCISSDGSRTLYDVSA